MMNKSNTRRRIDEGNVFTKEGIIVNTPPAFPAEVSSFDLKLHTRPKSQEGTSRKMMKKTSMVPFNFVKAKTPKHITINPEIVMHNYPVFFLNNKR